MPWSHRRGAVLAVRDERVGVEFVVKLKALLETLDTVMPDPAGLPFLWDAKIPGFIARCAAARNRDGQVDLRSAGEKVRKLFDDHITNLEVTVPIPSTSSALMIYTPRAAGTWSPSGRT